jgi:hypothetical protein
MGRGAISKKALFQPTLLFIPYTSGNPAQKKFIFYYLNSEKEPQICMGPSDEIRSRLLKKNTTQVKFKKTQPF